MPTANTRPRVAIPIPTSSDNSYNQRCWPQYAAAVEAAGGEAVGIPLRLDPAETAMLVSGCAAILLPGSPADVDPQKYGQHARPETAASDPGREGTDELLLQDAFHLRKPVLCICFGLQMMNVWRGGTLIQHIEADIPHAPSTDQTAIEHGLQLQPDAPVLRSFFPAGTTPRVNSSHHQAVDAPGDGLIIAARSENDRIVEALEGGSSQEQFVLGVQWHPERSYQRDAPSSELFKAFVLAAHRWRLPYQ